MTNQTQIIKPPTSKRNIVFLACCLLQVLVWTDEFTFGTLTPYWSQHFAFDAVQIASISGAYLLGYAPMLLVGGLLADIMGAKKMMLTAAVGCGILSFLMIFCTGFETMYWRNLVFGIFFGFCWAPCNKMMANWLPGHERGPRASLWGTLSTASQIFVAPLSLLIASKVGWEYAFITITVLAIPVILVILRIKDNPADYKGISQAEIDYINAGRDEEAIKNEKLNFKAIGEILKDWNVWVVIIAVVFATASTWMAAVWGSMVLMNGYGMSPEAAAGLISPMSIIPVVFSLFTGWFLNKVFKKNIKMLFFFAPIMGSICYILAAVANFPPAVVAFLIYGVAYCTNAWGWGGSNAYWAAYSKPELWGTLNGLTPMFQVAVGFTLVQLSGAWVVEGASMGGYGNIFLYTGILWLVGSVAALICKKRYADDTWETVRK